MTRNQELAFRVREVLLDGKWIANTNFKEQIDQRSWQDATHRVAGVHTIAELTFHINYYLSGVLAVLKGGDLTIRDRYSFDASFILSALDWDQLKTSFVSNASSFADAVELLSDEKLDEIFVDEKYGTYLRNIEGIIEHSYYHLGQVVLISKMIKIG